MAQTIPEELTKLHYIVADETCQTKHRWMALGITIVADENADYVRAKFQAWKRKMGLKGEVKWTRTDDSNIERYKTLIKIYMYLISIGVIQFHAILICMDVVDYSELEVPELSYSRFFHHLLMKLCRILPHENKYRILFDRRTSKIPMQPFATAANFAARRDYGIDHWPFRSLKYQDSKSDILLQVNDLILGAIGYLRNGKHKTEPKHSLKTELALYTRQASPVHSFWKDTGEGKTDFTLWALRFGGQKGKDAFRNRNKFKRRREAGQGRTRKPAQR